MMTPTKKSIPEILSQIAATVPEKRVEFAKAHLVPGCGLQGVLECLFHPQVKFDLPPGNPPYKPSPNQYGISFSTLHYEIRKIGRFLVGAGNRVENQQKRERLFINLLEALDPTEAKLLLDMKAKRLSGDLAKAITYDFVRELLPSVFPELTKADQEAMKEVPVAKTKPKIVIPEDLGNVSLDDEPTPKVKKAPAAKKPAKKKPSKRKSAGKRGTTRKTKTVSASTGESGLPNA